MKKIIIAIILLLAITSNVFAGTYMFHEKASKIDRWLEAKGESGTTYDMLKSNFEQYSTLAQGTLYDDVSNVMHQHGYSGMQQDMLTSFFQDTTSQPNRKEAERSFWANDSYSFNPSPIGNNFTFVDSNNFTFIDGNNFVFGS